MRLNAIDHVHVYVSNRSQAAAWYQSILGFEVVEKFRFWADGGGPLTLRNPTGTAVLALFEAPDKAPTSTIAFGVAGKDFLDWKARLQERGLELRVADHQLAWSMYFSDPDDNLHEITTYDYATVAEQMKA